MQGGRPAPGAPETWLREFVASSLLPQLLVDGEGSVLAISRGLSQLTGFVLTDLACVQDWFSRVVGEVPERAAQLSALLAEDPTAAALNGELRLRCKDGGERNVVPSWSCALGDGAALVCALRDLSDQRAAEAELARQREFLERLVRSHPTMLYVVDLITRYPILQNRDLGTTLGYSAAEMMAMGDQILSTIVHPDDLALFMQHLADVSASADGQVLTCEHRVLHRNGGYRIHVCHDTVFARDATGRATQMLGTVIDVTEERRLQRQELELQQHMQELQKMESLAMLAGGIAHDFNNLLVGILGSADLAVMVLPAGSPAHEDLERIQATAIECAELCKQLLAYAGKGKFVVEPFKLTDTITQIGQLLQISISKQVVLRYDLAEDTPPVEGDVRQIRQVIMNLIKNASDAIGDQPGMITLAVGALHASRSYLDSGQFGADLPEGLYVTIEVSDTGCGISKEVLPRIFEPFFTNKRGGRGLGLAAVRGIIGNHRGGLRVYSEVGKGTCFKVLLPASDKVVKQSAGERGVPLPDLGGGTVLVVDDEETVRDVLTRELAHLGFSVLTASDGREAVGAYREYKNEIRFVMLDMMMPGMRGAATFRALREVQPDVRVVLMSGYNEQDATSEFAGRGLAAFLQKPFGQAELQRTIEKLVSE